MNLVVCYRWFGTGRAGVLMNLADRLFVLPAVLLVLRVVGMIFPALAALLTLSFATRFIARCTLGSH